MSAPQIVTEATRYQPVLDACAPFAKAATQDDKDVAPVVAARKVLNVDSVVRWFLSLDRR